MLVPGMAIAAESGEVRAFARRELGLSSGFFERPYLDDLKELKVRFPASLSRGDFAAMLGSNRAKSPCSRTVDMDHDARLRVQFRVDYDWGFVFIDVSFHFGSDGKLDDSQYSEGVFRK